MSSPISKKSRREAVEAHAPYLPAEYTTGHALAMQHLAEGKASEDEQKMAFKWIVEHACSTYDLSYRPDSDRDTAFAEGRRFAGMQIVKLLHINTIAMKEKQ